ncbi:MAG: hypothetical protein OEU90_03290 [Gammaproteobacteria bacterium]|jgi:hypothetical protein|nr:hypothetical protein [Gammaproteobacteria bacterium]MDH3751236.1 hypothetical protein [Gammaproteobacteria bacterium]MDH3804477.1 hypothetical protein [Gammaproteobacteria bacterium]
MAIDPKYVELINADIDGEISSADRAAFEAFIADSPEAQALHAELSAVHASLDSLPELDSPPHLKHTIMASIPEQNEGARSTPGAFLQTLFAAPALRYTAVFAAGSVLTLSLVSSDIVSQGAFDDMTGLVGTISDQIPQGPSIQTTPIESKDIAGTVTLHSSGPILIVDFDLVSSGPVDIVASYVDKKVWFNGFAQLESPGVSVSAESGRITMQIDGKRRYALYLHNAGDRDITIHLQFTSNGEAVYDTDIEYVQPGHSG